MQLIVLVVGGVPVVTATRRLFAWSSWSSGVSELVVSRSRTLESAIASRSCSDFRKYSQVREVN